MLFAGYPEVMLNLQTYNLPDPAVAVEYSIASKLSELNGLRVDLFASTFENQGRPTQKAQVRVGWSGSEYRDISKIPDYAQSEEDARFEVEVEVVDVRTHASAMQYIRQAMILLHGFTPYVGIRPLLPVRAGDPRFNTATGSWLYTGILHCTWVLTNGEYPPITPINELPDPIDIILKVGRYAEPAFNFVQTEQFEE